MLGHVLPDTTLPSQFKGRAPFFRKHRTTEHRLWSRQLPDWMPALPLISCVSLGIYLTSLSLSFFVCKMGIVRFPSRARYAWGGMHRCARHNAYCTVGTPTKLFGIKGTENAGGPQRDPSWRWFLTHTGVVDLVQVFSDEEQESGRESRCLLFTSVFGAVHGVNNNS